jgi:dihydrofolate reductase
MLMIISLIVAMTHGRVIGRDNQIPWHMPRDLRHFRRLTLHKPIIMGRKTWQSLSRPLPQRTNIVLTRQADFTAEGALIAHTPQEALTLAQAHLDETTEVMVIGGTAVYATFLPLADRLYITLLETDEITGDAYFPVWDTAVWQPHHHTSHPPDPQNPYPHHFITYHRRAK